MEPEPLELRFDAEGSLRGADALTRLRPRRVTVAGLEHARLRPLLRLLRAGVRELTFVDVTGNPLVATPAQALALVAAREARRRLDRAPLVAGLAGRLGVRLDPPWPTQASTEAVIDLAAAHAADARPLPAGRLRIAHAIGALGAGGAERQLSYLVREQVRRGHRVRVLSGYDLGAERGHYAAAVRAAGASLEEALPRPRGSRLPALPGVPAELVAQVEQHFAGSWILALAAGIAADPPDVLHAWLDEPNAVAAVAGLLVGVPRIVLSTRNLNPSHFAFDKPWFRPTYRRLADHPRVRLIANSAAGADDYAAWAGIARARFVVVPNGVPLDRCAPLDDAARTEARGKLGLAPDAFLVAGVFRLAAEKQPRAFVEVLARAAAQVPRLRAVHLGTGPLDPETRALARARGLELRFLGRVAEPWPVLGAADACLLTSREEGFPNALVEAQALGVPVVATRAGGVAEAVGPEALLADVGDVEALSAHLVTLAEDPAQARARGAAGRAWVAARFGLERLEAETLKVYRGEAPPEG